MSQLRVKGATSGWDRRRVTRGQVMLAKKSQSLCMTCGTPLLGEEGGREGGDCASAGNLLQLRTGKFLGYQSTTLAR
eukprot:746828-Hanusia_phi.AAC.9